MIWANSAISRRADSLLGTICGTYKHVFFNLIKPVVVCSGKYNPVFSEKIVFLQSVVLHNVDTGLHLSFTSTAVNLFIEAWHLNGILTYYIYKSKYTAEKH